MTRAVVLARALLALTLVWLSAPAQAQLSGFAGVSSENNFRGRDLSDGQPVEQAGLAYDLSSGWFAGVAASEVRFDHGGVARAELTGYAGVAQRLDPDWSWEAGLTTTQFPSLSGYSYSEAFVGATYRAWSARLYYSPNYFGQSAHTLYAEINTSAPLDGRLSLFAHAGALDTALGHGDPAARQLDVQLGLAFDLQWASARVSWVDANRVSYLYPFYGGEQHEHWLLSLIATF